MSCTGAAFCTLVNLCEDMLVGVLHMCTQRRSPPGVPQALGHAGHCFLGKVE